MSKPPPPSRANVKTVTVVNASCSYQAQTPDELSFEEGDSIIILETTDKFWKCKIGQKEGIVPLHILSNDNVIENALHDACKRGNLGLITQLLAQGASVNGNGSTNRIGLDKAGNTPLHWAARSKHPDAVQILLTKSLQINAQNKMGDTPLHSACWGGSLDVVKLIAQAAGVKFDIKNKSDQKPLDLARNDDISAFLMQYTGHKTNAQDLFEEDE